DHIKECIASEITDIFLQEIKLNALQRVSGRSENMLVEIIARLIDIAMYHLPVDYEVEVTRAERQMGRNRFFESGKWDTDEDKIYYDHNKLVQLCLDSTKELVKKCTKKTFYQNYIGFRVNIAAKIPLGKELVEKIEEFVYALLVLQSIVNNFQKRSRKMSDISPPSHEAERLSKKNSANF
ncbi:9538_t:CDS:2, partial [Funneliformis mosseae]